MKVTHTNSTTPTEPHKEFGRPLGRRAFLGRSCAAAAAAWGFPSIGVAGVNEEIRIAIVGLNSKGRHHIEIFSKLPGVRIVASCDVDQAILTRTAEKFFKSKVGQHIDYREFVGTDGGVFFDYDGKRVKAYRSGLSLEHHANFLDAMRSRRGADLHASVLDGHLSSALCHMGNISQRLGTAISKEELAEECNAPGIRSEVFSRLLEHASVHESDFTQRKRTLGPSLAFTPRSERFEGPLSDRANPLLKDDYRAPFTIPELSP